MYSEMSLPVLAARCLCEIDNYRRGKPYTEMYGLELLHRAIMLSDQEAWVWVQQCFEGMVHGWVRRHPKRAVACRLESEENYVAQAFERFWQATAFNQQLEFRTLAAALQYLRASVNGAILDTLRTYARPGEVPLPEPGEQREPYMEDVTSSREIEQFCSQEWSSVYEIYRLRHTIMERVLRHVVILRWRLS